MRAPSKNLLDAEVEITGAVSGHFDNKMQMTGVLLHVQSLAGIKFLSAPPPIPGRFRSRPWTASSPAIV